MNVPFRPATSPASVDNGSAEIERRAKCQMPSGVLQNFELDFDTISSSFPGYSLSRFSANHTFKIQFLASLDVECVISHQVHDKILPADGNICPHNTSQHRSATQIAVTTVQKKVAQKWRHPPNTRERYSSRPRDRCRTPEGAGNRTVQLTEVVDGFQPTWMFEGVGF